MQLFKVLFSLYLLVLSTNLAFASNARNSRRIQISSKSVTATTVFFQWKLRDSSDESLQSMKIRCKGTRSFITAKGKKGTDRIVRHHYFSLHTESGLMGDLKPNMEFECTGIIHAGSRKFTSNLLKFTTLPDDPEKPQTPTVVPDNNGGFLVMLYNTSTRNGPLSGYEMQFHLVDDIPLDDNDDPMIDDESCRPFRSVPTIIEAEKSLVPTSFAVRTLFHVPLPREVVIDGKDLLQGALKRGSSYVVVVTAFLENLKIGMLFSHSKPSSIINIPLKKQSEIKSVGSGTSTNQQANNAFLYVTMAALIVLLAVAAFALYLLSVKMRGRLYGGWKSHKVYGPLKFLPITTEMATIPSPPPFKPNFTPYRVHHTAPIQTQPVSLPPVENKIEKTTEKSTKKEKQNRKVRNSRINNPQNSPLSQVMSKEEDEDELFVPINRHSSQYKELVRSHEEGLLLKNATTNTSNHVVVIPKPPPLPPVLIGMEPTESCDGVEGMSQIDMFETPVEQPQTQEEDKPPKTIVTSSTHSKKSDIESSMQELVAKAGQPVPKDVASSATGSLMKQAPNLQVGESPIASMSPPSQSAVEDEKMEVPEVVIHVSEEHLFFSAANSATSLSQSWSDSYNNPNSEAASPVMSPQPQQTEIAIDMEEPPCVVVHSTNEPDPSPQYCETQNKSSSDVLIGMPPDLPPMIYHSGSSSQNSSNSWDVPPQVLPPVAFREPPVPKQRTIFYTPATPISRPPPPPIPQPYQSSDSLSGNMYPPLSNSGVSVQLVPHPTSAFSCVSGVHSTPLSSPPITSASSSPQHWDTPPHALPPVQLTGRPVPKPRTVYLNQTTKSADVFTPGPSAPGNQGLASPPSSATSTPQPRCLSRSLSDGSVHSTTVPASNCSSDPLLVTTYF